MGVRKQTTFQREGRSPRSRPGERPAPNGGHGPAQPPRASRAPTGVPTTHGNEMILDARIAVSKQAQELIASLALSDLTPQASGSTIEFGRRTRDDGSGVLARTTSLTLRPVGVAPRWMAQIGPGCRHRPDGKTIDELAAGDSAHGDTNASAWISGNGNPARVDEIWAQESPLERCLAHGRPTAGPRVGGPRPRVFRIRRARDVSVAAAACARAPWRHHYRNRDREGSHRGEGPCRLRYRVVARRRRRFGRRSARHAAARPMGPASRATETASRHTGEKPC